MRKLLVLVVVLSGFAGLVGLGAFVIVLSGMQGAQSWSGCSAGLGPSGDGRGRGESDAGSLDQESVAIAKEIIKIGKERNLPPRAWQVAIQAGKTESNLANLTHGDRDSLGIFQMRPSMGWGSVAQVTDVQYQINKFYDVLLEVPDWEGLQPGTAAQRVERSAYPLRYHEWEPMAAHLVSVEGQVSGFSGCEDLPSASVLATKAISFADQQIGKPYVWGAAGPSSFDCSGLTQMAWKESGVHIPKYSRSQYTDGGAHIPLAQAQPGDLVFWGAGREPGAIHHVALYLGDNQILHAPQPGESVERTEMWDGGELLPTVVRPGGDAPPQAAPQQPSIRPAPPSTGEPAGVLPAPGPAGSQPAGHPVRQPV
ncbi:C40 family peptidase [Saccharopolyspora gloriosae]|uniref:NlpC/P60 domain-containing protein n=1 Tax=Saccharopolyspora gloriosae TaxID=455344 RepID=A0A840N7K1_9PSEU|nr:C40 family peptidase [Saccharopolyspora gloriosae]MBB5068086.1 hypothetical protein [Saccharopolyspora gloriosae]